MKVIYPGFNTQIHLIFGVRTKREGMYLKMIPIMQLIKLSC